MNHLYNFTTTGAPWAAVTWNVCTDNGRASVEVRRGAARLRGEHTACELRFMAAALSRAADELERTARQQNEDWLDRRGDPSAITREIFAEEQ